MGNKKKGKILAVLLSGTLLGTQIPGMSVAEGAAGYTGGICEHHPVHTAECGYQEAVPEQPCRHEHTEECYEYVTSCVHVHTEECYPLIAIEVPAGEQDTEGTAEDAGMQTEWVRGLEPTACTHVCSEDSGCVTRILNCIHEDKVNADGSITYAVHDAGCGYAPAVEGKECTFVCETCSAQSLSETETEALTVQTGIAAARSADSEPSAKTTEAGNEGTDEDETDSETETSTEETPDSDAETETDAAVTEVQAMIEALPSVEKMTPEEQNAVYNQAQNIADTYYDELTEEQQKQVDLTKLMDLMNYFNGQVSTMDNEDPGYIFNEETRVLTITSDAAFSGVWDVCNYPTNFTSVVIEEGVTKIGDYAFLSCSSLTEIEIPGSVRSIGESAFEECTSLAKVTIQNGVTSIGSYAFLNCRSLTEIEIPGSVRSIGSSAFSYCKSLAKVTIQDGVTSIGSSAFNGCSSLTEIVIPGSVQNMTSAFQDCKSLAKVTIQNGVTSIGSTAFNNCSSLTEIEIPGSVQSIESSAFNNCSSLTEITIPDGVNSIGNRAFMYCNKLATVTLPSNAPTTSENAFSNWGQIDFIIPAASIGSGEGQYDLTKSPWNQMKMVTGVIGSVTVDLAAPQAGGNLPSASSVTNGVSVSSSWNPNDTVAVYETTYTVTVTLSVQADNYKFADSVAVTFNDEEVETEDITEKDGTLTFTQTYQTKQAQNSPQISIDYQNEKLNTTADMEYRANEEEAWTTCTADMKAAALGWDGTKETVQIRMKETADAYASDPLSVTIPARPAVTVSQTTGSTTASGLTVSASVSGAPAGVSPEVQYQLVADGDSIDSGKWQDSGAFTNLKADTAYTAYAKCGATTSSFASDTSSGQTVSTAAAAYTVTIPSEVIAGDSTNKGKAEISVNTSKSFDLGYNGQVQVKVESNGAVSTDGKLTLTQQGASDTITSAMLVNGTEFTDINKPVAVFKMENYQTAKTVVSFAQPETTDTTQTVIPAGTYSGTVTFEVSYSD